MRNITGIEQGTPMTRTLLASAALLAAAPAMAADINGNEVSFSIGTDYVTEYVFRGVSLADDAIQPYAEASVGGFTLGIWASTGIGENSELAGDEIDVYASYGFELAPGISGSVGGTYYHYPQGGSFLSTDNGGTGSYEVNAGVSFDDVVLAPSATAYYDFTLEAFTLEGGVGHSLTAGERSSLDIGVTAGLVDGDGFSYEYATGSLGYAFGLTDDASLAIGVNYTINSEDDVLGFSGGSLPDGTRFAFTDRDDLFWGGIGISTSF